MTCVVALIDAGRAYFAADSVITTGDSCDRLVAPKVWKNPAGWVAGWAGHAEPGLVLAHALELPPPPVPDAELDRWAALDVVSAVAVATRDHWPENEDDPTSLDVLIGVRGRLYLIDDRATAIRVPRRYAAIGSGSDVALGSLGETEGKPVRERLVRALTAAARHTVNVRKPWRFAGP